MSVVLQKGISVSQPLNHIRLATYLPWIWDGKPSANCQAKVIKVWAVPDSLATTTGIVVYFLFLALLRCFSSGGYLLPTLCIHVGVTRHYSSRVTPFGYLRIKTYVAVPRSFSQLFTSFFGIACQGILCVRLSNFLLHETNLRFFSSLRCSFP